MPLRTSVHQGARIETNQTTTSAAGTVITADATPNTKGSWTSVIASTARDAYGIILFANQSSIPATDTGQRLDLGIGASPSSPLIPDLLTGWSTVWQTAMLCQYSFPVFIPSGVQLSARMQSVVASGTVNLVVWLLSQPMRPDQFVGSRVTAYGVGGSGSQGTNVTAGQNIYGTAVSLTASTTNPIRYMQIGIGGGQDTAMGTERGLARIQSGSTVLVDSLAYYTLNTEAIGFISANSQLAQCGFDLPSGIDLSVASMLGSTASGPDQDYVVYGVD